VGDDGLDDELLFLEIGSGIRFLGGTMAGCCTGISVSTLECLELSASGWGDESCPTAVVFLGGGGDVVLA
jgi:hypothetical protein